MREIMTERKAKHVLATLPAGLVVLLLGAPEETRSGTNAIPLPSGEADQEHRMAELYRASRSVRRTIVAHACRGPEEIAGSNRVSADSFADLILVWRENDVAVARDRFGLCRNCRGRRQHRPH